MAVLGHVQFTASWLIALVQAAIGLAVAFGAPLSPTERQAIIDVITALSAALPVGGAMVAHAAIASAAADPAPPSPSDTHTAAG